MVDQPDTQRRCFSPKFWRFPRAKTESSLNTTTKKYVTPCEKSEYYVALGEVEESAIRSGKEISAQIRKKDFELRGFRARALRLFLIWPIDVKFVHVGNTVFSRRDPEPCQ
jgi:hypothetical protein